MVDAVAKLDQTACRRQSHDRYVAVTRGRDNRRRARTESVAIGDVVQFSQFRVDIEGPIVHGGERQVHRCLDRGACRFFFLVGDDDRVDAALARAARAAIAHVEAHAALQLEGEVLHDMRQVRAAAEPLDEPAGSAEAALVVGKSR